MLLRISLILIINLQCSTVMASELITSTNKHGMGLGLYVVVSDMDRAREFYQQLLLEKPFIDTGNFVGYRIGGGLFALYSAHVYSHELTRGNNIIPYIQVADIDAEFERVKRLSPKLIHEKVLVEDQISLFMFSDPSGNLIEFFSINTVK